MAAAPQRRVPWRLVSSLPGKLPQPARGVSSWAPDGPALGSIGLLHGVTSSSGTWWRLGPALAAAGWEVTAVDLPGHGDGPRPRDDLAVMSALADGAAGVLPGQLTALVGHSLGAIVALEAAARYPKLARGLVLEDPPGMADLDTALLAAGVEAEGKAAKDHRDAYWQRVRHDNPDWDDQDVEHHVAAFEAADTPGIAEALRAGLSWDLPGLIAALQVPLLVIAAPVVGSSFLIEGGSALRGEDREAVRGLVPEGRFVELDGGHSLHREHWASIAALIGAFALSLS
jgi:pimeloyl-ACP methyl ester carboxylesterase